MCPKLRDVSEPLCQQEPILADNLDSATAFFYTLNQLIRSTSPDTSEALRFKQPRLAVRLIESSKIGMRELALSAVGWVRRAKALIPGVRGR